MRPKYVRRTLLNSMKPFGHCHGHTFTKVFFYIPKKEDIARFTCSCDYNNYLHCIRTTVSFNKADLLPQEVVTLEEETINTPVFAQLDERQLFLVTERLGRFVLVGEASAASVERPFKILRLAVFAPLPLSPQPLDYGVRVYILEDTQAALEVSDL